MLARDLCFLWCELSKIKGGKVTSGVITVERDGYYYCVASKKPIEEPVGGSWMGSSQYSLLWAGLIGYRSQLLGFRV